MKKKDTPRPMVICPDCFYRNTHSLENSICDHCGWTARDKCYVCREGIFSNQTEVDDRRGHGIRHGACDPHKVVCTRTAALSCHSSRRPQVLQVGDAQGDAVAASK